MAFVDLNDYLLQTYGTLDLAQMQSEIVFADGPRSVGEIMATATQQLSSGAIVNVTTGEVLQQAGVGQVTIPLMVNTVIPQDDSMASILAALEQARINRYGTAELGAVRRVGGSGIVNEMSGVRPGFLPRIVLPVGARKERGWPG